MIAFPGATLDDALARHAQFDRCRRHFVRDTGDHRGGAEDPLRPAPEHLEPRGADAPSQLFLAAHGRALDRVEDRPLTACLHTSHIPK